MSVAAAITQYGDRKTLALSGRLSLVDGSELRRICEAAGDTPGPHLVVDLSDVESLDRYCIRLLESLATDTLEAGAAAAFVAPSETVRQTLVAYGLRARISLATCDQDAAVLIRAS